MLTKNLQRSCRTSTCSPQRLREHGFVLQTEALTTILNKHKHTYLPFLHVLPRNCPADRNTSCKINYALNAWYAIARTAGTSLKHSPGRHFSTNKGPGNFTISTCENLLVREGQLQQPCKQQPVIAEACAQGKAQGCSAGFRSWALPPARAALGSESQGHCHGRCHRSSCCCSTALSSGRMCRKPAQSPAPEHKSKGKLCLIPSFGHWSLWVPSKCKILGGTLSSREETKGTAPSPR